jgi:hypothetical protein
LDARDQSLPESGTEKTRSRRTADASPLQMQFHSAVSSRGVLSLTQASSEISNLKFFDFVATDSPQRQTPTAPSGQQLTTR